MKVLMAIDPGLQGTGYAIWRLPSPVPIAVGVLNARKGAWLDRVDTLALDVMRLARRHQVHDIICEMMEMHQSTRGRMAWAAGDLQRTVVLIGTIHGLTRKRCRFHLTPPSEWKGQLPKRVTIMRVQKCIGRQACLQLRIMTHAWDAVGIGLWYQGLIK